MRKPLLLLLPILLFATCKKSETPTNPVLATITTTAVSAITATTATTGGNITSDGGSTITSRGVCWNTSTNPTITNSKTTDGTGTGIFVSSLTALSANTTYYVRAYATNSTGTAYGSEVSFTTSGTLATITTTAVSAITSTTATTGGNITNDGGSAITSRGVSWNTSINPSITNGTSTGGGSGTGSFTIPIMLLSPNTTYYVRAYATNSTGTAYGNNISFTTLQSAGTTVTDIDGNVYNTVTIGTQVWMAENLKVTKYRNGDIIPQVTILWSGTVTGAWCYLDNNSTNNALYGKLYNWHVVKDTRFLAPQGWHIPSDAEWTTLTTFLGGESVAGGKMKEAGTTHWLSPNTGATNSSGFKGLPAGFTYYFSSWDPIGYSTYWWSSSECAGIDAFTRHLYYDQGIATRDCQRQESGASIRCIKD
jgi:uncharacterized protein (TIGR02145 family)